jgi:hypothetical protein
MQRALDNSVTKPPHLPGSRLKTIPLLILSFLAGLLAGFTCYLLSGNSLQLFVGGLLLLPILVPPCSARVGRLPVTCLSAILVSLGISTVWCLSVFEHFISFGQWAVCLLILSTFVLELTVGSLLLQRLKFSSVAASALITVAGLAWLSWPIWLSGSLAGEHLEWSVRLDPLFALNHVVANLGVWTEQPVAYQLTTLGQDVQYQLPTSAWPVIGSQLGVGIGCWGLMFCISRIANRSINQIDTEASAIISR